ncbi:MAG: peptide ABC transporter substrate-binding protein [Anaerolineaceae bacterium]|nr:peptide ABC transporter substrate-binding protein [Anaerolineaceae bacterium]
MKKFLLLMLCLMMAVSALPAAAAVQEITYALANEPDGIDPGITNNSFASPILNNVFEGLVAYSTEDGSLIPGEAESWEISDDGTVYTFTLRDGLKWSDGSDHTAQDYVYAMKRILDPATGARYVDFLLGYVAGAAEYYEDNSLGFDTVGVKALDDQTLEMTLIAPAPYWLDILTMWTFSPVQEATIAANGDRWTASAATYVTNGPFMMSEINLGESFVLVKNPYYYDADEVNLEKVTFRFIADLGTSLMAYENGDINGMQSIPSSDIARLKAEDAGVVMTPSYGTVWYDFNCAKAPFDNVLVRKAFCLAVDRTAIIEDVAQVDADPAYSFMAPGYVVDGEDLMDEASDNDLSDEADVEAAQEALAEAGYPNGEGFPEITLSYYSNESVGRIVEAVARQLQDALNINIKISNADWAVYYDEHVAGNYDIGAMGWSGDYVHPMTFLQIFTTGDANNNVFYSNTEYDALVKQAANMTDAEEAFEVMREAEAVAAAEYPVLPLYYKANTMLMHDNVEGYFVTPSNALLLKTAYVED